MADLKEIKLAHQSGDLKKAKLGYLSLLEKDPHNIPVLHLLSLIYAEENHLEQALLTLEKVIKQKPQEPIYYLHYANFLKSQKRIEEAISILLNLTEQYPNLGAAYNNLGTLYFVKKDYSIAIQYFKDAINCESHYLDAYYNLGLALIKNNQTKEAKNVFESLLELSETHQGAHFQLAKLLMHEEKFSLAIKHFEAILLDFPQHFETLSNLATVYLRLGKLNEAKSYYLKALEIDPNDEQVLFNLGVINMQQGRMNEALHYYLQVIKRNPHSFDAHNNLGFANLVIKNQAGALLHFREAARLQPENKAIQYTIDILTQNKSISSVPIEYTKALFDSYADHFETHLIENLKYQAPKILYEMVKPNLQGNLLTILDLGCGTGLCGDVFYAMAKTLVGVDVSEKMLSVANQKEHYDELICSDINSFLKNDSASYDLILAADALEYFGELKGVFSLIEKHLTEKGWFAFNAEMIAHQPFEMTNSGRFAHSKHYLDEAIEENGLRILDYRIENMRTQEGKGVLGHFYLVSK